MMRQKTAHTLYPMVYTHYRGSSSSPKAKTVLYMIFKPQSNRYIRIAACPQPDRSSLYINNGDGLNYSSWFRLFEYKPITVHAQ